MAFSKTIDSSSRYSLIYLVGGFTYCFVEAPKAFRPAHKGRIGNILDGDLLFNVGMDVFQHFFNPLVLGSMDWITPCMDRIRFSSITTR